MERMEQLQAWLKRLPVTRALWLLTIVLVVLSARQAALLTWQLLTPPPAPPSWQPPRVSAAAERGGIDLQGIMDLGLFGTFQPVAKVAPVTKTVTSAPKTNLNLQLAGVVASSDPSRSLAIIANRGNQETYVIDDSVSGTQARVHQIFADRVILDNSGRFETLYLDDEPERGRAANPRPRIAEPRRTAPQVISAPAELLDNPAKIAEMLNISPVQQDGQLVGYRVNPGKDPALFKDAGLEPNDLAVSINGYDLTDNEQAMQMLSELSELTELTLTVERDGQLHQVFISLQQ